MLAMSTWARIRLAAVALVWSTALTACPAGQSSRCRDLCQTVVACVESLDKSDVVIDETECTITCTSLERDPQGKNKVDEYALCLQNAKDCEARLSCNGSGDPTDSTQGP